jgi:hypothetical protein
MWAECIQEYVYENFTVDPWIQEITKRKINFNKTYKRRQEILYRGEFQPKPKMIIILNAEQINPKTLKDINEYLRMQTVVCYDSSLFYPADSIVRHIKKPIKHYFLNEDATAPQKFLYSIFEKRLVPLSKDPEIKVHEYTRQHRDLSKLPKPVISCSVDYDRSGIENKITKGDLAYATTSNWRFSLEDDRYYLHSGIYCYIDSMSKRDDVQRITSHPTYTSYKFRVVPNIKFQKVQSPHLIDKLPPWRFKSGSIIVPKVLHSYLDAKRIYSAVNMFLGNLQFYIVGNLTEVTIGNVTEAIEIL